MEGVSQNEIATRLGVPSFAVRNLLVCARAYKIEELEKAEADFCRCRGGREDRKTAGCIECGIVDCKIQYEINR